MNADSIFDLASSITHVAQAAHDARQPEIDRLKRQNADMLAALEMVESCFAPEDNDITARTVREAIARAKGTRVPNCAD